MRRTTRAFGRFLVGCSAVLASLAPVGRADADSYKIVHAFSGFPDDGKFPIGNLAVDDKGDLYGVTEFGGGSTACGNADGCGTLYKIAPDGSYTVAHQFCSREQHCSDGALPQAGVAVDDAGNIFGSTFGVDQLPGKTCPKGCGNEYRVNGGTGKEDVLARFRRNAKGDRPASPPLRLNGHIYGTTFSGGTCDGGTLFEIKKIGDAPTVLHPFCAGHDGYYPFGPLAADDSGNVYGTTVAGGTGNSGTVFRFATAGAGKSGAYAVLYSFCSKKYCADGTYPFGGVSVDSAGNLYGTTQYGGPNRRCSEPDGCGTVFSLATNGTETVLHAFAGGVNDGAFPYAGVLMDKQGDLYGTTENGGAVSNSGCEGGCGTVFKLAPDGSLTLLHIFNRGQGDGVHPYGGLTALNGKLYGTASLGGPGGSENGLVFKLKKD